MLNSGFTPESLFNLTTTPIALSVEQRLLLLIILDDETKNGADMKMSQFVILRYLLKCIYKKNYIFISISILLSILGFQNCQKASFDSNNSNLSKTLSASHELHLASLAQKSNSPDLCHQWVTGNNEQGVPTWGPLLGNCSPNQTSFLMSVTHENDCNSHLACKGYPNDLNYRENIKAYMADYHQKDIGTWLKYSAKGDRNTNQIELALDTINYANSVSATGRPVSNGYLFYGLADLSLNNHVTLNDNVWIEFDYRIIISELSDPYKSGHRLILGASLDWGEPNRSNRAHFFEINLFKTLGFHSTHVNINQCPKDATYDHCFYDPNGKWAEGKYVSTDLGLGIPNHPADNQWRTIRVNIFQLIKKFQWFHSPASWNDAKTSGFYIGIESRDRSHLYIGLRNIRVTKDTSNTVTPLPPPSTKVILNGTSRPVGLFRDGIGGYRSNGASYCSFGSSAELMASGYTQSNYDNSRQIPRSGIKIPFEGRCSDKIRMGLVRQQSAGLIRQKEGFCLLSSGAHLLSCGFRQEDYDQAPQVSVGVVSSYPLCTCY